MDWKDYLKDHLGEDRITENKNLKPYLTLRTDVIASIYVSPSTEIELIDIVRLCHEKKIDYFVLGGGSNVALLNKDYTGLVIHNQYRLIDIVSENDEKATIRISSGTIISQIVRYTIDKGLEGFEYQLGLPGTLGGAVYMNSKWTKPDSYIGDRLVKARLIDIKGNIKEVDHDYFAFAYGYSRMQQTRDILLHADFILQKTDKEKLVKRSRETLEHRMKTQPKGVATSGCFFKNISESQRQKKGFPTRSAGYLIDQCDLKGYRIGGFEISSIHANFIVNTGNGTIEDLRNLVTHIKTSVKKRFGINLLEEVIIL